MRLYHYSAAFCSAISTSLFINLRRAEHGELVPWYTRFTHDEQRTLMTLNQFAKIVDTIFVTRRSEIVLHPKLINKRVWSDLYKKRGDKSVQNDLSLRFFDDTFTYIIYQIECFCSKMSPNGGLFQLNANISYPNKR